MCLINLNDMIKPYARLTAYLFILGALAFIISCKDSSVKKAPPIDIPVMQVIQKNGDIHYVQ